MAVVVWTWEVDNDQVVIKRDRTTVFGSALNVMSGGALSRVKALLAGTKLNDLDPIDRDAIMQTFEHGLRCNVEAYEVAGVVCDRLNEWEAERAVIDG